MSKFDLHFRIIDAMQPTLPFYDKLKATNQCLRECYDTDEYSIPECDIATIEMRCKVNPNLTERESMLIELYTGFSLAYNILHCDQKQYRRGVKDPSKTEIELVEKIKSTLDLLGIPEVLLGDLSEDQFNSSLSFLKERSALLCSRDGV